MYDTLFFIFKSLILLVLEPALPNLEHFFFFSLLNLIANNIAEYSKSARQIIIRQMWFQISRGVIPCSEGDSSNSCKDTVERTKSKVTSTPARPGTHSGSMIKLVQLTTTSRMVGINDFTIKGNRILFIRIVQANIGTLKSPIVIFFWSETSKGWNRWYWSSLWLNFPSFFENNLDIKSSFPLIAQCTSSPMWYNGDRRTRPIIQLCNH